MKIACVQSNVVFANPAANAGNAVQKLRELHEQGVQFAVFPEAYLTGYCVTSPEEAASIALEYDPHEGSLPDALESIRSAAVALGMHVVVGFAGEAHDVLYNGAMLLYPDGKTALYKKTHLPDLGLDKFVTAGDQLPVFDTEFGKIAILICFDLRHPEASRVVAMAGADLIVLPTNWPVGAEVSAQFVAVARASENKTFYATCDRVGEENGFKFIGLSKIISPTGQILASAGSGEEVIVADIDLSKARPKRNVLIPGKYEITLFESRRPELYGSLQEQH